MGQPVAAGPAIPYAGAVTGPTNVFLNVQCDVCHSDIELECRGLQGFWGYLTYNAYVCPHCRKQNHALSTGAVIAARLRSGAHV